MAAPISGAPTLTTTDSADEPGMKRTRLNEAFDALSQVRLRARSLRCSPGWPILTLILIYAALAVCLALALACPPAHGDASAPKAPSGAGAPLPNTSASADHYRFPLTREPKLMSATTRTVLCLAHSRSQAGAGASTSHPTNLPPSSPRTSDGGPAPAASDPHSEERDVEEPARADGTTKPKPLDRPCELEFKQVRGPNQWLCQESWAP